jgi:hypothetical protein
MTLPCCSEFGVLQVYYFTWWYRRRMGPELATMPGNWSLAPPSPGSISYLAVSEEDGSRAYCHAQVVRVQHRPLQVQYPTWWYRIGWVQS